MKHDTVIISIYPELVSKIVTGKKCYEYRKHFPKDVKKLLIYATAPVKRITAIAYVDFVLCDTPAEVWRKTGHYSGITKEYFDAYFKDASKAYAIKLMRIRELHRPIFLSELKGVKAAPQSYAYFN